jgi:hypothetical protein
MERERIYCFRRSFVSESDNVIETLNFDSLSGSPNLPKLVTGRCRLLYRSLWFALWQQGSLSKIPDDLVNSLYAEAEKILHSIT